jgi:RNA polymerase sigma-70 factor (ECF subfamily)
VFNLAMRIGGDREEAAEVLQETMLKVLGKIGEFRGHQGSPFWGWLRQIAVNEALMRLRSQRRFANDLVLEDDGAHVVDPGPLPAAAADAAVLTRALNQLPSATRSVLWLYHAEGYTHEEIAALMQRTPSFSKSQLARGSRRLRELLEPEQTGLQRRGPMPDTAHPDKMPHDWNTAFAALPLETPPADGWSRLSGALDSRAAVRLPRNRRNRLLALAAVLAIAALAPLLLMREHDTSVPGAGVLAKMSAATPPAPAPRTSPDGVAAATPSNAIASTARLATGVPDASADVANAAPVRVASRQATTKRASAPTQRAPSTAAPSTAAPSTAIHDTASRPGTDAIASSTSAGTTAATVDASNDRADTLMQLQAESARLEALIAMTRDDRVGSAAATVMSDELGQRIGLIDAGLTQNALPLDQREALWRERVRTLRDLAGVETTQLWLAAQGERYDGALVSVD